jgi:protein-L-isoaspartate(D-aspartate) O-methyltransferase
VKFVDKAYFMTEMEYAEARERMVREQLEARGITDRRVLAAMRRVPRHRFVPEAVAERAYEDCALPIGYGQTISQPLMVALIAQALDVEGGERVLDVGTGSGYQAALLAEMGAAVVSIERQGDLAAQARKTLAANGYERVHVIAGDGSQGYAPHAPYDRIAVAAGSPHVPTALVEQLAPNGRLILPVGSAERQYLTVVSKGAQGQVSTWTLGECQFVPLVGAQGWPDDRTE